jgi:multicomponent Na+:H+ antiporter subunit E
MNVFQRIIAIVSFFLFYLKEVVFSNFRVARDVLSLNPKVSPGIVAVPIMPTLSDVGITLLANLISMTPGSLSVEYQEEKRLLHIHSMYLDDEAEFIDTIKTRYEQRIARILNP